jgi:hypothetical protein
VGTNKALVGWMSLAEIRGSYLAYISHSSDSLQMAAMAEKMTVNCFMPKPGD